MKKTLALASLALLWGCGGNTFSPGTSSLTPYTDSVAYGINDNGFIVGSSSYTAHQPHAMLIVPQGQTAPASYTVTDIADFSNGGGMAEGISANGKVVGWGFHNLGAVHGFLYSSGSLVDIPPPAGDASSIAHAVNNLGMVVGSSYNAVNPNDAHAMVWSQGLGSFTVAPPSGTNSGWSAISNNGVMVGTYLSDTFVVNTMVSDQGFIGHDLSNPPIGGAANCINDNAYVAGDSAASGTWWFQESLVYTPLPNSGGINFSQVHAINNSNIIVGSDKIGTHTFAVKWTLNGVKTNLGVLGSHNTVDLNDHISLADQQTYGAITDARGIAADGRIVCNTQFNHVVLLTPAP